MRRLLFGRRLLSRALPPAAALAGARTLGEHEASECAPRSDLKELYGSALCTAGTFNKLSSKRLRAEADLHTLDMQARGGVKGSTFGDRLVHLGADHSEPAAKAINVGAAAPDRLIWAASSAQTKAMHSILLVPNGEYASMQAGVKELRGRPGGPPRLMTVDDMPNNHEHYMEDLEPQGCAQDLKHGEGRVIITLDNTHTLYAEVCAELASCYLVRNQASVDAITAALQLKAGQQDGALRVKGKYTRRAARDGVAGLQVAVAIAPPHPPTPLACPPIHPATHPPPGCARRR